MSKAVQKSRSMYLLSTGFAMFSMFFGAGNVVFPMLVGFESQGHIVASLLGLCATAVGLPFLGLYVMIYFDGEYRAFFDSVGKLPGFLVIVILLGLTGPFGGLPRCIAFSYSTYSFFMPSTSPILFSLISVVALYFFSIRKSKIVDILGTFLTPLLLLSLAVIIVWGIFFRDAIWNPPTADGWPAFSTGMLSGYHTMDLIVSFFFSHFVVNALKKNSLIDGHIDKKLLSKNTLIASIIGAVLLGIVYCGLTFVAAKHSEVLVNVPSDKMLAVLALYVLGPFGGIATCVVVLLACLTTAIALTAIFSEFCHKDLTCSFVSYKTSVVMTLVTAFFFSTLEFQGIFRMLAPIVQILYPSLIVLSILNIAARGWNIPIGKTATFVLTSLTALIALGSVQE